MEKYVSCFNGKCAAIFHPRAVQKLVGDNFKSADALIKMPHVAYLTIPDPVTDRANAGEHQRLRGKLGPVGPTEESDEGCAPSPLTPTNPLNPNPNPNLNHHPIPNSNQARGAALPVGPQSRDFYLEMCRRCGVVVTAAEELDDALGHLSEVRWRTLQTTLSLQ